MVKSAESLEEFYGHKFSGLSQNLARHAGQFNVFRIEDRIQSNTVSASYIRRDFFKIMLYSGTNNFHYGDRTISVEGSTLLFFNPRVPYTYDSLEPETTGCFCVFKEDFFQESFRINLSELPLFSVGFYPVFKLSDQQHAEIGAIFEKVIAAFEKDYIYKFELIKSYVSELIYLALQLRPASEILGHIDAGSRITSAFMELLERQFPIESASQRFTLRSPKAIADKLSVHVNYLNRAIKKTTGRTTTDHIFERLAAEAKALLKYTDWSIGEISYALGFEDQAHFNNFFKKQTNTNPSSIRKV
ncbi:helix-turn-helix domain-containing protein [Flavobacterium ginsenosidimutans]|uniref:helix-turn-helix domain-containing protein n=1 Tax=Flavobacterium ginsenosidimutans TaxID=687844 RepID=UPI000DAF0D5D|nr:helix-turn-helix domain-containing protein [Flavobacterium ginsenosidimutans]KAF2328035.1 AraC family transcriptional regulator [Flavobacterium ginsenosidimutans]